MLIADFGPIYLRLTMVIDKNTDFLKNFSQKKSDFKFFNDTYSFSTQNHICYPALLNMYKMDIVNTPDHKILLEFIKENKITEVEYLGVDHQTIETVISKLFSIKSKKFELDTYSNLGIKGVNLLALGQKNIFFEIPGQELVKIFYVGHNLDPVTKKDYYLFEKNEDLYPYLFVNLNEGVSIYRVDNANTYKRLGGSTIGFTTFWGLVKLACGYSDPEEAIKDALKGKNENVDLTVGDIYGGDYKEFNLDSRLLASALGKVRRNQDNSINKEDITRSVLTFVCINIVQLSYYWAKLESLKKILFVGHQLSVLEYMQMMQMAINYFSAGEIRTFFSDLAPFFSSFGVYSEKFNN